MCIKMFISNSDKLIHFGKDDSKYGRMDRTGTNRRCELVCKKKQFVDEFGMTPLMYAVLGSNGSNASVIAKFVEISSPKCKNCLGHTAFDIFLCLIGRGEIFNFADRNVKETFKVFDPNKNVKVATDIVATIIGDLLFNAVKAGINQKVGTEFKRSARELQTPEKYYTATITNFQKNDRERIEKIFSELKTLTDKNINIQIFMKQQDSYFEETYKKRYDSLKSKKVQMIESKKEEFIKNVEKDEFETHEEYQKRREALFYSKYPEFRDSEIEKLISEVEKNELKEKTAAAVANKVENLLLEMKNNEKNIEEKNKQIELLKLYCFPPQKIKLGTYNADEEYFLLKYGRYKVKLKMPRSTAKIFRENENAIQFTVKRPKHFSRELGANCVIECSLDDISVLSEQIGCFLNSFADPAHRRM